MKCPRCGAENTPETVCCTGCGTQIGVPDNYSPGRRSGNPTLTGVLIGCGCLILLIPILAAILFPVFAKARESARKVTCQQNLKELGRTISMYCRDYNDTLPTSAVRGRSAAWDKGAFSRFAAAAEGDSASWKELLLPYKQGHGFSCPSDGDMLQEGASSYYWKAAVDYAWFNGFKKKGDFGYPADQIVMYEHNGWHFGDMSRGLTDGVTINCLFMDGHVRAASIKESGYTLQENPPGPLPAGGTGEPAWFNCEAATGATAVSNYWKPDTYRDSLP